jgi:hypothetical protein
VADSLASRDPCGPACANSLAFGGRRRPPILLDEPLAAARDVIGKDRATRVMSVRSASIVATEILGTWAGQVFSDPHFGTEQRVLDAPVLICLA